MSNIYDLHEKAFAQVSAFVILKAGERVATIAFKFPRDGAGRLYAYVHWFGVPMVRGFAGGYGYDKRSAAVADAVRRIAKHDRTAEAEECRKSGHSRAAQAAEMQAIAENEKLAAFKAALDADSGEYWDSRLRAAGFDVLQAV